MLELELLYTSGILFLSWGLRGGSLGWDFVIFFVKYVLVVFSFKLT